MTRTLSGDPLAWEVEGPSAVAVGVFDGVHLGHQAVLRHLVERAGGLGARPVALTFDPHPLEFIAPERAPRLLTEVGHRVELLGECGIEVVGVLPFLQIRDLPPETFVADVLAGRLGSRLVAVGSDFRFGHGRAGDAGMLASLGPGLGFEVEVVDLVGHAGGEVVSSSHIRRLVAAGQVADAARLLGRPFELRGPVMHGDKRGRSIGFPTANLHVAERMATPAHGVYAARAAVDGAIRDAVVNVGVRPTFGEERRTVEAHLLDVDLDLYGHEMRLRFVDRIRDERRFAGVDELARQIGLDVQSAREVLGRA